MTELLSITQYINIVIIPVAIIMIRLERRLTRIETILEIKMSKNKKEK